MLNNEKIIYGPCEFDEKHAKDIYDECERRGAKQYNYKAFVARMWLYPEKQAQAFVAIENNPNTIIKDLKEEERDIIILLEVLIELRPNHEMQKNGKKHSKS